MIIDPSALGTILFGLPQTTQDLEWHDDAAATTRNSTLE
jgi:hypothetical protein